MVVKVGTAPIADSAVLATLDYKSVANIALKGGSSCDKIFILLKYAELLGFALKCYCRVGWIAYGYQVGRHDHSNKRNAV